MTDGKNVVPFKRRERMSAAHALAYQQAMRIAKSFRLHAVLEARKGGPDDKKTVLAMLAYEKKCAKKMDDIVLRSIIYHATQGFFPISPTVAFAAAGAFIKRHRHTAAGTRRKE